MFDDHLAAMASLGQSRAVREEIEFEQHLLDNTLLDGLGEDPWPVDADGEPVR